MKQRLLYQYVWLIVCVVLISGGRIRAQSITTIGPPTPVACAAPGTAISVPFSTAGVFSIGNIFTVQLSDNGGTFPATPTTIASLSINPSTASNYSLAGIIPVGATAGSYRIRVVSSAPSRTSTTISIGIAPTAPAAGIASPTGQICPGTPVSLTALGSSLKWFGPDNVLLANNISTYNFSAAGPGTYNYTVTQLVGLCESPGRTVTVTVANKSPNPTISPSQPTYCVGVPGAALNASGSNLRWYGTNINNASPGTTPTIPPTNAAGTIGPFYVSQNSSGCESDRIGISVTVNAIPGAPSVTTPLTYCQSSTSQPLSPSGSGFRWYNSGNTLLPNNGAAPSQSLSSPGNTTYLVSAVSNGCESTAKSSLVVNVNASPVAIAPVTLAYCQTSRPAALTVSGSNVRWYSDAAGNSQISVPAVPTVPNTYTYYVRQFDSNGCGSAPSSYIVRVAATPGAPGVAPESRCLNETPRQLTASGTNLSWFDNAGAALPSAPSPPTSATGTLSFQVSQANSDGCVSPRATLTITINGIPSAPTATPPAEFCEGKAAPVLSATGANLRWYSLNPTGGTFTTSPTPVNNALIGTSNYYVAQVVNGCESPRTAIPVTVKDTPNAPGVSNLAFCQNSPAPVLNATSVPNAALIWSTSPSGTQLGTAPIIPNGSPQIYPYYVFQRLNGCDGPQSLLTVTVKPLPAAPTTTPLDLCLNGSSRSVQAQGNNLRYYEPNGNSSNNPPTPPTNDAGTFTYQVTQTLNECEGPRAPLRVTVFALPPAPTVADVFYCQPQTDQPAQSVGPISAQGQNLRWYNSDGNQFSSAPTPPIDRVRTLTFQVTQTVNNCEGGRATLNVIVRTTPAPAVSVTSVSYCRNDQATPLQATAEAGASLRWLDPNGNLTNDAPTPITLNATAPGGRVFNVYQIGSNGCYSPRSPIRLFVNTNPTLALFGSTTVNLGRTAPLQLRFTGVPPFSYALSDGTVGISNDTLITVNVMPPQTTVFQVASVTNICGQGLPGNPATATITVKIPTITTGALPNSVVCAGTGLSVPFTTAGEFNQGNAFRVEITTDTTSRVSTTVGVGSGQEAPIGISLPSSLSAGLYYVRVVASNPGIAVLGRPSPVVLNIRPLPTATLAGTQDVYEGSIAKLNVAFTGDGPWTFAYADSLRSTTITTNANPHVIEVRPLVNSSYKLLAVNNNCGDGSISGTARVSVLSLLGVEDDPLGKSVNAYPIPTTSTITVDIDLPLQRTPAGLTITDVSGRSVLQKTTRDRQTTLDLSQHPAGIYLLNVTIGDKQTTRRVLKQ